MKQAYKRIKFKPDSLALIERVNSVIERYKPLGITLTLRQLYYQFVKANWIENSERSYKNLGKLVNNGRLAGLIDWESIEDRMRSARANAHWDSPKQIITAARNSYAIDMWYNQPTRVEVWIEKDALVNVIETICMIEDVRYLACRGYVSQSEQWRAGERIRAYRAGGQDVKILYLGDHDPSGIDMTRDHRDRLTLFCGEEVEVKRLALNRDQIDLYQPPPNPAKLTDSRSHGYCAEHGFNSWELDALEPSVIRKLVRDAIYEVKDPFLFEQATKRYDREKKTLDNLLKGL